MMQTFKVILILAVGLVAGVVLHSSFSPKASPPAATEVSSGAQVKLQSILDHEYADYLRLKNLEEKYSKADEILAKIVNIFLADLQLHFVKPSAEMVTKAEEKAQSPTAPTSTPSSAPQIAAANAPATASRGSVEVKLENIRDRAQVSAFLSSQKKTDFNSSWTSASAIKVLPTTLNGCFEGNAQLDPNGNWYVTMFYQIDNKNVGEALVILVSNGERISRQKSRGDLTNVRGIPNDSQAVLMEISPSTVFQLFYLPSSEEWIGNIYEKRKDSEVFKYKGKLSLHRGSTCERP